MDPILDDRRRELLRTLRRSLLAVLIVAVISVVGYMYLEGWNFLDSLYMTIILISTIGLGEAARLDASGKGFTIFVVVFGLGTVGYALKNATKFLLEGELRDIYGRKKLEQRLTQLKDHYIICGYGRMGRLIAREMARKPAPFVVIERDPSTIPLADKDKYLFIQSDADKDEVLLEAGIKRAKGLISVVSTDADNLYIVLTARGLNPDLQIVARAGEEGSEQKLIRAGASRVISPYLIGADRIAQAVLRPAVVDFIEFATQSENIELKMEEVTIKEGTRLAGLALNECGIRQELGIIIVAIKRSDGKMEFNPSPTAILHGGDCLIALGQPDQLKVLEEITAGR